MLGAGGKEGALLIPMTFGLSEQALPDALEQFGVLETTLTEQPINLSLTITPDIRQIEDSADKAAEAWQRRFNVRVGAGAGVSATPGGVMDELWAGGVAW